MNNFTVLVKVLSKLLIQSYKKMVTLSLMHIHNARVPRSSASLKLLLLFKNMFLNKPIHHIQKNTDVNL